MTFQTHRKYSRADVMELVGLGSQVKGGPWFTGLVEHDGEFFIFASVGTPGRTGHDYGNHWQGEFLRWYHKGGSTTKWPTVKRLLIPGNKIHLFSRSTDRDDFSYHGYGIPVDVVEDSSPVEVLFAATDEPVRSDVFGLTSLEILNPYVEGSSRRVEATIYERDPAARQECIDYYGAQCVACNLRFEDRYGPMGSGYIHVHHLVPLSSMGEEYQIDPIRDLRPLCPNCHAMVHQRNPPFSVEYVETALKAQRPPDL